jgi:acyl-[acyl carrier protein]--UDP-N-acetylglucosamine O-acyltransferase
MSADASQQFAQFAHRDSASLAALTTIHQFYAMGSDCAVHLCADTSADLETFAIAAEMPPTPSDLK